jgi:Mg-chelatase subunit ChlI
MPVIYPFTAIVGQERMRRALVLNAVDPRIGGVLIRGERGTAKSTAARALAALLPNVRVVADCRFGCAPDTPQAGCTECRERHERGEELPVAVRPTPSTTSRFRPRKIAWWVRWISSAPSKGRARVRAGRAAAANRGLLYIDEVNLRTITWWTCCWIRLPWA